MRRHLLFLGFLCAAVGCAHRPVEELILADVAVRAAQKVKADALSPDAFRKAENNLLRAKKDFVEGYYDSCRKYSNDARLLAEQAEYKALLKQNQIRNKGSDDDASRGGSSLPSAESEK